MMNISHLKETDNKWNIQSNEEHCHQVAQRCAEFTAQFGCRQWGKICGSLHDLGKNSIAFQRYIAYSSGYDKSNKTAPRTPHAYIGAIMAQKLYPELAPVISFCIMAHHGGLHDKRNLEAKLTESLPPEIEQPLRLPEPIERPNLKDKTDIPLFIRMLFSALVDADRLDTEAFMSPETAAQRSTTPLSDLKPMLEAYLAQLKAEAKPTKLNLIREEIQQNCLRCADIAPGFFSLTVPTGGGKTLSSLVWAMQHAVKYQKKRIIIAIPYTSIIVQTAQILRNIFGNVVLEHHSNTDYEEPDRLDWSEDAEKLKLISENWEAPIIVTTNVQLFESLFSNRASKCRKLHNLTDSILILDEVQSLPLDYLSPILDALRTLQRVFGVSVLFTTASQPAIEGSIRYGKKSTEILQGLNKVNEIIPRPDELSRQLRRTRIVFDEETSSYEEVAKRLTEHPRVLCIVNTRRDAQEIYTRLPQERYTFHLSRMMCPAHVKEVIEEIKRLLKAVDVPVIRVVATQLIEAGVDIDFPVVFRQEAGLDSIIQAAGRCNREGLLPLAETQVFRFPFHLPPGSLSQAAAVTNRLDRHSDWFHPETMKQYFIQRYNRAETLDKVNVKELLYRDWNFETVAQKFHLIEENGRNLIVNYKDSPELVERLKREGASYGLMRKLSAYTVGVPEATFKELFKGQLVEEVLTGIYWAPNREQYDANIGLVMGNHWLDEILIK